MQGTMMQHVERGLTYVSDAALKSTFLQILDAVEHIHDNGLGHRDLKPENILCSEDGLTVKICDFGVAVDCERAHLSMAGSLPYMPPEVLELGPLIKSYSAAAGDVWACCILLLNMIGGRCPWKQADTGDFQFAMFLEDPLYLMATFRISEPLYRLLLRGLHQDPRYRPSVTELRRGIKKIKHFYKREPSDPLAFAAPFISKMKKLIVSKRSPPIVKPAVVVPAAASRPPPVTPVQLPPPMSRGELSLRPMVFKTVWSTPYGSEPPSAQPSWHRSDHGSSSPESDWVSVLSTFNSQAEVVFAPVGSVAMSACSSPLPWLKDDVPAPVAKLALLAPPSFSTASSSAPSQSSSSTRPSFANSELVSKYSTHGSGRFGLLRSWPQQSESA
ncbi:unnamed protein product [Mycena citricolor]|nr:unnamed protein product [Mycena citricolor]